MPDLVLIPEPDEDDVYLGDEDFDDDEDLNEYESSRDYDEEETRPPRFHVGSIVRHTATCKRFLITGYMYWAELRGYEYTALKFENDGQMTPTTIGYVFDCGDESWGDRIYVLTDEELPDAA